jgi:glutathione S-transferase
MVLKLFGYGFPTCTRLVGAVLREKKIPFQMITIDLLKGEQKSSGVMAHQPFGQVPFIVIHSTHSYVNDYLWHDDDRI